MANFANTPTLASVPGEELLASLASFVHDIYCKITHSIIRAFDGYLGKLEDHIEKNDVGNSQICSGTHDTRLLSALVMFLRDKLDQPGASKLQEDDTDIEGHCDLRVTPLSQSQFHVPCANFQYPQWERDQYRKHVFNNMPIRLLSFNADGTGIRLMERDEIYQHISDFKFKDMVEFHRKFPEMKAAGVAGFLQYRSRYAILSHTWIRDNPGDVVYGNWDGRHLFSQGFEKITRFCEVAAKNHGVTLGWMDTVCINKDSSSELDESIRSMFKWYQDSAVCVAYLSGTKHLEEMHYDLWFTRGWTLQELLAPRHTRFYNTDWIPIEKTSHSLVDNDKIQHKIQEQISTATTITVLELDLCKFGEVEKIPMSRRMQMAVGRNVTRAEDEAYSLMGLLGVDIPIAYGEGMKRAFYRLLREILSSKPTVLDIFNHKHSYENLLPSSVWQFNFRSSLFSHTGHVKGSLDQWQPVEPITLTHLGVRVPLLLIPGLLQIVESRNPDSELIPQGNLYGVVSDSSTHTYDLLDSRIYADEVTLTTRGSGRSGSPDYPLLVTFGVFNFGAESNNIFLPQQCLAVALDCGIGNIGRVGPSDRVKILTRLHPTVFELEAVYESDRIQARDELINHGIQLVTLYL